MTVADYLTFPRISARVRTQGGLLGLRTGVVMALGDGLVVFALLTIGSWFTGTAANFPLCGIIAGNVVIAAWVLGLYPGLGVHPAVELRKLLTAVSVTFLPYVLTGALTEWALLSPGLLIAAWAGSIVVVSLGRWLNRQLWSGKSWWGRRVVVVGDHPWSQQVAAWLKRDPSQGLKPAAEMRPADVLSAPPDTIDATAAVLAAAATQTPAERASLVAKLSQRFRTVVMLEPEVPALTGMMWARRHDCGGVSGLQVIDNLNRRGMLATKRALDVCLCTLLLIGLAPLCLLIVLAIKLTSRGPLFYGHERIGRGGLRFRAWKFRSMEVDADQRLAEYLASDPAAAAEWQAGQKLRHDPRVTWVGRLLRKTSLDELPQLWNVMRGDMSLVGPRPIVDDEIAKYDETYESYLRVRPGLTGLWQVSGRNNTTYERRVALDSFYVRNWSLWLDIYILARTMKTVVTCDGC